MADELEDIELGERVAYELAVEQFVGAYAAADSQWQMSLLLVGRLVNSDIDNEALDELVAEMAARYEAAKATPTAVNT